MKRTIALSTILLVFAALSSCGRHEPPEEVIRTLCSQYLGQSGKTSGKDAAGSANLHTGVEVIQFSRKGLGESKHTRGMPDNKLVYPVSCLVKSDEMDADSDAVHLFLYFYRDSNGKWATRSGT